MVLFVKKSEKKDYNAFTVEMKDMTEGKLLALHNALKEYADKSRVANDVFRPLSYELLRLGINS